MLKRYFLLAAVGVMTALCSCSSDEPASGVKSDDKTTTSTETDSNEGDNTLAPESFTLCKGADISWLTEMESKNWKFYYEDGTQGDCIEILKDKHVNAIRLRVWVNPTGGWCGTTDVIAKAKRAAAAGMDIMIDFHYSDTWADPSKQTVPAAWSGQDASQLCETIGTYTKDFLTQLKAEGVTAKWVQVGNETGNGLLWPYGQADKNPKTYADMISCGYDAVKEVYPSAKVIVHLQNGQDKNLFTWNLDILKKNGAKYDVVGMSLYPERDNYASYVEQCKANMLNIIVKYDKDVMLCEVGMGNSYVTECKDFLNMCFRLSEQIDGNRYLGLLYWEPQCYNDWNGYKKGCFTATGKPSAAMDAFSYSNTSVPMIPF